MSVFRSVVLLSAVIALMPSDRGQQEKLQKSVAEAAHWSMTFCERNARTCETSSAAWAAFKEKAEFAAGMAYTVAMSHVFSGSGLTTASTALDPGSQRSGPVPHQASMRLEPPHGQARGTLTEHDLTPDWRGTTSRKGI